MKIKKLIFFIFLSFFKVFTQDKVPYVITFFFRPLIYNQKKIDKENLHRTVSTPGIFTNTVVEQNLALNYIVNGIFVTYGGFFTYSGFTNDNGQIRFPRRNKKPRIKILVTQMVTPIFEPATNRPSATINHWELSNPESSQFYICELKQDPDIKLYFWHTSQRKLPTNKIIPNDTLIIFADPENIIIPTGPIKLGTNTPHFFLPDIFVSTKINRAVSALRFLKIKKYFAPIKIETKFDKEGYQQLINV